MNKIINKLTLGPQCDLQINVMSKIRISGVNNIFYVAIKALLSAMILFSILFYVPHARAKTSSVAAGVSITMAIKEDGSLYAWGWNVSGQFGDGTYADSATPKLIGTAYKSVVLGTDHTLAIKTDGSLWAWGYNYSGQLGVSTISPDGTSTPMKVGEDYIAAAAGNAHSVALKSDGSVWAWGNNDFGQIGDGSYDYSVEPKKIGDGFQYIAAGGSVTAGIKGDGTLWIWGSNSAGQLANTDLANSAVPLQIPGNYSRVAVSDGLVFAIDTDQTLWAWGDNASGVALGLTTDNINRRPTIIGTGYIDITTFYGNTLAIKSDRGLWQLAFSLNENQNAVVPVLTKIGSGYSSAAAGDGHFAAIKDDKKLWLWGSNWAGQLGTGDYSDSSIPVLNRAMSVPGAPKITSIASSDHQITINFTAPDLQGDTPITGYGVQLNEKYLDFPSANGQIVLSNLDNGTPYQIALYAINSFGRGEINRYPDYFVVSGTTSPLEMQVLIGRGSLTSSAGDVCRDRCSTEKATGSIIEMTAVPDPDQQFLGWTGACTGLNKCRVEMNSRRFVAAKFGIKDGPVAIMARGNHTLVLKADGSLWGWGDNLLSQLTGNPEGSASPKKIGDHYKAMVTGSNNSFAIDFDGNLWAWGANDYGQLGDGTTNSATSPIKIGSDFIAVSAGYGHTLALKTDSSLWAWGQNSFGQLGDGTFEPSLVPQKIGIGYASVSAGSDFSIGVKADGSLWSWGSGSNSHTGLGTSANMTSPTFVGLGFQAVSAGWGYSLALKFDGSLWTWGESYHGQFWLESISIIGSPTQIDGDYIDMSAGELESSGIKKDGSLWQWGAIVCPSSWYSYGDNYDFWDICNIVERPRQIDVGYVMTTSGAFHISGLKDVGAIVGWGSNRKWQAFGGGSSWFFDQVYGAGTFNLPGMPIVTSTSVDDGSITIAFSPPDNTGALPLNGYAITTRPGNKRVEVIESPITITGLTNGQTYDLILVAHNALGDSAGVIVSATPQAQQTLSISIPVSGGTVSSTDASLNCTDNCSSIYKYGKAISLVATPDSGHTFLGWIGACSGRDSCLLNMNGHQLVQAVFSPGTDLKVVSIATSTGHTLALTSDGSVWAWGNGDSGQIGQNSTSGNTVPTKIGTDFKAISTGDKHSLALKTDGSLWGWGANNYGQLGDGTFNGSLVPKKLGEGYKRIYAGSDYSLAIKLDNSLWAWGGAQSRTVGYLIPGAQDVRVPNKIMDDVASVAPGSTYGFLVKSDRGNWGWGDNSDQKLLGYSDYWHSNANLTKLNWNFNVFEADGDHSFAIDENNVLYAWGRDVYGQLGASGQQLPNYGYFVGSDFLSVSARGNHALAVKVDGSLWAWGRGSNGEIGDGSFTDRNIPKKIGDNYFMAKSDTAVSFAIDRNGRLFAWGSRTGLGFGYVSYATYPTQILFDTVLPTLTFESIKAVGKNSVTYNCDAADIGSGLAYVVFQVSATDDFSTLLSDYKISKCASSSSILDLGFDTSGKTFFVRMAAYDVAGNSSGWVVRSFSNLPAPIAAFSISSVIGESPLVVGLTSQSSGLIDSYAWSLDGSYQFANTANAQTILTTPGSHTITLSVTNTGGTSTISKTITVTPDKTAPAIGGITLNGVAVNNGITITSDAKFSVSATDAGGVASASASLNGVALPVSNKGGGAFDISLATAALANGNYTLLVTVTDVAGNSSQISRNLTIAVPPPAAPSLSAPVNNLKTNKNTITVTGSSALGSEAQIYLNNVAQGSWLALSGGSFTASIPLSEGSNAITAEVRNLHGTSSRSGVTSVTLDTVAPTVSLDSVTQIGAGRMEFRYTTADSGTGVARVVLQIADAADFSSIVSAESDVATSGVDNRTLTAGSRTLYARVAAIDNAGNRSAWSSAQSFVVVPPPVAAFSLSATSGEAPVVLQLTDQSTGGVSNYSWNFGGGTGNSSIASPQVTFTKAGSYTVTLTVSGVSGSSSTSKTVTITADKTPPAITALSVNGIALSDGTSFNGDAKFSVSATDAGGVASASASLNGVALPVSNKGGGAFDISLATAALANGNYTLLVTVTDVAGNSSQISRNLTIAVPPPAAPSLSAPVNGLKTNNPSLIVSGSTTGNQIRLYLDGSVALDWTSVTGNFQQNLTLPEGQHTLAIEARDVHGTSSRKEMVVTLDTSKPAMVGNVLATGQAGGKIHLTWNRDSDPAATGYNVYRASSSFDSLSRAQKLNSAPLALSTISYDDLPPGDGTWYYRIASINALGTENPSSTLAQAVADATAPKATSIVYTPQGRVDVSSGRIGQGLVGVVVTVSEPLLGAPYLAIVPAGGTPIPVDLTRQDDNHYSGTFAVDANTLSGVANAIFSARDVMGNRGTDIMVGATLKIDTAGPVLTGITLTPGAPIQADARPLISAVFSLSKAVKPGTQPQLQYLLSGPVRTAANLSNISQVDATTWRGDFTLPSDAALASAESFSILFRAQDDLDNQSTQVTAANRFQVYQGKLPPLAVPLNFAATAQPGGKVKLSWSALDEAVGYQLYRQAPGETTLSALQRSTGTSFVDATMADGSYLYAIASIRSANGQESLSAQSPALLVQASASAPGAPQNLALSLTGQGIVATWQAPVGAMPAGYRLYRAGGSSIAAISGLTPIKTGIKQSPALDASPSPDAHAYVVTAVDAAGNESTPSNSAYLNFNLLPVASLSVSQIGSTAPQLSWSPSRAGAVGYDLYVGPADKRIKLNTALLTGNSYIDTGYSQGERQYTVVAVDAAGAEQARSLTLPAISSQIISGLPLKRGVMNQLQIQVTNSGNSSIGPLRAGVSVGGTLHRSADVTLAARETRLLPVVVGGYSDLPDRAPIQLGIDANPAEGEQVSVGSNTTIDVTDSALALDLLTESFTRGGSGQVRLSLSNSSEVEVELLTARSNGAADSDELRLKLLDTDGNVLSVQPWRQSLGASVLTISNGQSVARIPAGGQYQSDPFSLNIPAAAPDKLRLRLEVDRLRYHSGQGDQVLISGKGAEKAIVLMEAPYIGELTSITPISSHGEQDIVIAGRARDRTTGAAVNNVALKLVLNQQGFERTVEVMTDGDGRFSYHLQPSLTDGGLYQVSVLHPALTERPKQGQFVINRLRVSPASYDLTVPRNYRYSIPFQVLAGAGSSGSQVQLLAEPGQQLEGNLPKGVSLSPAPAVAVAAGKAAALPLLFSADNQAQPSGSVVLSLLDGSERLGQVRLNYTLTDAHAYLVPTPGYVETGLARGSSSLETVQLKNQGVMPAVNVQLNLTDAEGHAAPAWVALAGPAAVGDLAVGESRSIDLSFTPPPSLSEGVYRFNLTFSSEGEAPQVLPVYAAITQSGQGGVLFKVSDAYTATVGKDGRLIAGLAGARIVLQNEAVASQVYELNTDLLGEAMFSDLPAGRYQWRATAANHQQTTGRLLVKPGLTGTQALFLDYQAITVEWSVREVTVEDRYDIVLKATYETDVPVPVVLLEPLSISLPLMQPGEVFQGELSLTNYGLVRADEVKQTLPTSDAWFRIEFLATPPEKLEAKQRVTLPYRIVALKSLAEMGAASGAGCWSWNNHTDVSCTATCANGSKTNNCGGRTTWSSASNSSCGASSSGGGGGGVSGGPGGIVGNWYGAGSDATPGAPPCVKCGLFCCAGGGTGGGAK